MARETREETLQKPREEDPNRRLVVLPVGRPFSGDALLQSEREFLALKVELAAIERSQYNNSGGNMQRLVDTTPLQTLLAKIKERYTPLQVWLFGSRARGDARPSSDWDLFVVVEDNTPDEQIDLLEAWRLQYGTGVSADIIPCPQSAFEEDLDTANTIPYAIAREGVLLYER